MNYVAKLQIPFVAASFCYLKRIYDSLKIYNFLLMYIYLRNNYTLFKINGLYLTGGQIINCDGGKKTTARRLMGDQSSVASVVSLR